MRVLPVDIGLTIAAVGARVNGWPSLGRRGYRSETLPALARPRETVATLAESVARPTSGTGAIARAQAKAQAPKANAPAAARARRCEMSRV